MGFLVHWAIGHETKKRGRSVAEAVFISILDKASQSLDIFFFLHGQQALILDFLEVISWSLPYHLIEIAPAIFVDQIFFYISKNVEAIKEMSSLKLSSLRQTFNGWN